MATSVTEERPRIRAVVKYVGRSPYKVRHVANLVRGKNVEEAQSILTLCDRAAAEDVGKLLNSAVANAEHNNQIPGEELCVKEIFVDEGPTAKRFRPRARGRGNRIFKRSSHITIILERMDDESIARKAAKDAESGVAKAREQRRRRAEASKAAAKAKQEEATAADEEALLDTDSDESVEETPKAKKSPSKKDASAEPKKASGKTKARKADVAEESEEDSSKRTSAGDKVAEAESVDEAASDSDTTSATKAKKKTKEGDA